MRRPYGPIDPALRAQDTLGQERRADMGVAPIFDRGLMNSSSIRGRFTILLLGLLVSGCTVGPHYRKPVVQIPDAYHDPTNQATEEAAGVQPQAPSYADLPWWEGFQD